MEVEVSSDLYEVSTKPSVSNITMTSRYTVTLQFRQNDEKFLGEDINRRKKRRQKNDCYYLTIRHKVVTPIEYVGEQLWRGSLLLSDYLIYRRNDIQNSIAFELGAGVGFLSIIASLLPFRSVYCTDYDKKLVELANTNVELNSHLLSIVEPLDRCPIFSKVMNWHQEISLSSLCNCEGWNNDDEALLTCSDILWLAADVIYDDQITEALFQTLSRLMKSGERLWLSLEKRFNFEVDVISLVAHGYNRFLQYAQHSLECKYKVDGIERSRRFSGKRISLLFPQYIEYDRTKDLELWEIIPTD